MKLEDIKKELSSNFDKIIKRFVVSTIGDSVSCQQRNIIKTLEEIKAYYLHELEAAAITFRDNLDDVYTKQISKLYINYRKKFEEILSNIVKRKESIVSSKNPSGIGVTTGFDATLTAVNELHRKLSDVLSQSIIGFKHDFSGIEKPRAAKTQLQSLSDKLLVQEVAEMLDSAFKKIAWTEDYGSAAFNEEVEEHKAKLRQELQSSVSKADVAIIEIEEIIFQKKAQYEAKLKEEQLAREKARCIEAERHEKEAAVERERMRLADVVRKENRRAETYNKKVRSLAVRYAKLETRTGTLIALNPRELEDNIKKLLSTINNAIDSANNLIKKQPNNLTTVRLQQKTNQTLRQVYDIKQKLESRQHNLKMISHMSNNLKELLTKFCMNENNMFAFFEHRRFMPSQVNAGLQKFSELAKKFEACANELKSINMPNESELEFNLFSREKEYLIQSAEHYARVCKSLCNTYNNDADVIAVRSLVSRLLLSEPLQKLINHSNKIAKDGELGQMKAAKINEFHYRLKNATTLRQVEDLIFAKTSIGQHLHTSICATRSWLGLGSVTSKTFFNAFLTEAKSVLNTDHKRRYAIKM